MYWAPWHHSWSAKPRICFNAIPFLKHLAKWSRICDLGTCVRRRHRTRQSTSCRSTPPRRCPRRHRGADFCRNLRRQSSQSSTWSRNVTPARLLRVVDGVPTSTRPPRRSSGRTIFVPGCCRGRSCSSKSFRRSCPPCSLRGTRAVHKRESSFRLERVKPVLIYRKT